MHPGTEVEVKDNGVVEVRINGVRVGVVERRGREYRVYRADDKQVSRDAIFRSTSKDAFELCVTELERNVARSSGLGISGGGPV